MTDIPALKLLYQLQQEKNIELQESNRQRDELLLQLIHKDEVIQRIQLEKEDAVQQLKEKTLEMTLLRKEKEKFEQLFKEAVKKNQLILSNLQSQLGNESAVEQPESEPVILQQTEETPPPLIIKKKPIEKKKIEKDLQTEKQFMSEILRREVENDPQLALQIIQPPKKKSKINKEKEMTGPKRPKSSYLLFCEDFRSKIKQLRPTITAREMQSELAKLWKHLDDEQKEEYKEKSGLLKKEYQIEVAQYKQQQQQSDFVNKNIV